MVEKLIRSGGCWAQLLRKEIKYGIYKITIRVKLEKFI